MNRRNISKLIARLESNFDKIGFNMRSFAPSRLLKDKSGNGCGTSCCIGGHAVIAAGIEVEDGYFREGGVFKRAAYWLGLTEDEAADLFLPEGQYCNATPAEAVKVLRHLRDTGIVEWSIINEG